MRNSPEEQRHNTGVPLVNIPVFDPTKRMFLDSIAWETRKYTRNMENALLSTVQLVEVEHRQGVLRA